MKEGTLKQFILSNRYEVERDRDRLVSYHGIYDVHYH
jgi:hypothetical protein